MPEELASAGIQVDHSELSKEQQALRDAYVAQFGDWPDFCEQWLRSDPGYFAVLLDLLADRPAGDGLDQRSQCLISLALNVPPWEDLHELSSAELQTTRLSTTDIMAEVLPGLSAPGVSRQETPVAELSSKPVQDRVVSHGASQAEASLKSTRTAEAAAPTGAAPPANNPGR